MRDELVLVVGGTGMLGEPVARQLHQDGYRVRIFTRSPEKARSIFSADYEIVAGDVEDGASLDLALKGCSGVHINLLDASDPGLEQRGAKQVAAAAARAQLRRITYLSGATVCQENAWFAGTKAKLQAEAALRACGVPYTIFRASSFFEGLPRYVRGKSASVIGKQSNLWRWVAAADYARIVSAAYSHQAYENQTVYVLGPEAMTTHQALTAYCRIAEPGVTVKSMPMWMAKIVASVFRVKDLAAALPYLQYFETAKETQTQGAVIGEGATTTLEEWSKKRQQLRGLQNFSN